MIDTSWIAHRRPGDGELVGYLVPAGEEYRPVNVLGHPLAEPMEIVEAMDLLEEIGMRGLDQPWWLHTDEGEVKVLIHQATPDHVVVVTHDFTVGGNIGTRAVVPVPVEGRLTPVDPSLSGS